MTRGAQRYNERHAPPILPGGAISEVPGLIADRGSAQFAEATRDLQELLGLTTDGYFGPATARAAVARWPAPAGHPARERSGLPVGIWGGFARPSVEQLRALKSAGCTSYTVNLNDAGARGRWEWSPARARTMETIERCLAEGFDVWLMPWVWCDAGFMARCAEECTAIVEHFGRADDGRWRIRGIELDAEGSWEVSARSRAKMFGGIPGAVAAAMLPFLDGIPDGLELAATLLYFNRPAGDALLRHVDRSGEPVITEAVIQAYSVWLPHKPGTHTPGFQPGTLQHTAFANYDQFKFERHIESLVFGLGWWAQERHGRSVPEALHLDRAEAIRKASDAILDLNAQDGVGIDGVKAWAMHLWDQPQRGREGIYWPLALREIEYLTSKSKPTLVPLSEPESLYILHEAYLAPLPDAFRPQPSAGFERLRGHLTRGVIEAATVVRARNNVLGTRTPFVSGGRRYEAVDCMHTHTYRGGKVVLVRGGLHGVTCFGESRCP